MTPAVRGHAPRRRRSNAAGLSLPAAGIAFPGRMGERTAVRPPRLNLEPSGADRS